MADPRSAFLKTAATGAQAGAREFGVPASVTLAQAVLESGWGEFHLGPANNYFGIKAFAHGDRVDVGPIASGFVVRQTHEVVGGRDVVVSARFRSYRSLGDSMRDHGNFLRANSRYAPAFAFSRDPNGFARAIAKAGYATDPAYADKLIGIMRANDLYRFDNGGEAGAMPRFTRPIAALQRDLNTAARPPRCTPSGSPSTVVGIRGPILRSGESARCSESRRDEARGRIGSSPAPTLR